jgi:hypothetical protein
MSDRSQELREWEKSRKGELWLDTIAHWTRSSGGLFVGAFLWEVSDQFHWAAWWKFALVFGAGIYLTSKVITWLRLGGSYIERRLTEIEARIVNTKPYYGGGDLESFDCNPLFDRLAAIEERL